MIKVKLGNLVTSINSLREMSNYTLKGKIAYKISKILQEIDKELALYDESRYKLLEKYCTKDENGKIILDKDNNGTIEKDKIALYNQEMLELNNTDIQLNVLPIDIEDIEDIETTPKIINDLDWIIKKQVD